MVPSDKADGSCGPGTAVAVDGSCCCGGAQRIRITLFRCNSQSLGMHFSEQNFVRRVVSKSKRKHLILSLAILALKYFFKVVAVNRQLQSPSFPSPRVFT